jgi:large subunit ribosomal protein L17
MRKNVFGRQFSRDTNQRKSLFKSLISALILQESIKTTLEKAKAIKGDVDKIINRAKRGNENLAVQLLQRSLGVQEMKKVIKDLAPRFKDRTSGYTRIVKLGRRFSDNAAMVAMEWVIKSQKSPAPSGGNLKSQNLTVKELPAGKIEKEQKAKKIEVKPAKKETKRKVAKK